MCLRSHGARMGRLWGLGHWQDWRWGRGLSHWQDWRWGLLLWWYPLPSTIMAGNTVAPLGPRLVALMSPSLVSRALLRVGYSPSLPTLVHYYPEPAINVTHYVSTSSQDPTLLMLDCSPWPNANISALWLHNGNPMVMSGQQQLVVNITEESPSSTTLGIFQCFLVAHCSPAIAVHRLLPIGEYCTLAT